VRRVIVRYRVKPDRVEENERLVRAVYEELHRADPAGFRYATFKLDDGVTFVHVAESDGDPPLSQLAAFGEFQREIAARCDEPPVASRVEQVGSFGRD
jgi:hypothetical protein